VSALGFGTMTIGGQDRFGKMGNLRSLRSCEKM
jgi:hypothetical protein